MNLRRPLRNACRSLPKEAKQLRAKIWAGESLWHVAKLTRSGVPETVRMALRAKRLKAFWNVNLLLCAWQCVSRGVSPLRQAARVRTCCRSEVSTSEGMQDYWRSCEGEAVSSGRSERSETRHYKPKFFNSE
jgi:hypothetical protein